MINHPFGNGNIPSTKMVMTGGWLIVVLTTLYSSTALGLGSSCKQGLCGLGDRNSAAAERAGELVFVVPNKVENLYFPCSIDVLRDDFDLLKHVFFSWEIQPGKSIENCFCFCCSPLKQRIHKILQDKCCARLHGSF